MLRWWDFGWSGLADTWEIEGKRLLSPNQATPSRSIEPIDVKSRTGLLWREDWQCGGLQELDEGSKSIQQKEAVFIAVDCTRLSGYRE